MARGGKRIGAGRKPKNQELGLPALLDEVVTEKDQQEIIKKIAAQAKGGSFAHQKLWMEYKYGRPAQSVDITTNGESLNAPEIDTTKMTDEELAFLDAIIDKQRQSKS